MKDLAVAFLRIAVLASPIASFANCSYFTLRSGGKTWITMLFDSVYLWVIRLPLVRLIIRFTGWPIMVIYAISVFSDIMKCILGYVLLKRGTWVHNIVERD